MIKTPKAKTCVCRDCKRVIPVEFFEDGFCKQCIAAALDFDDFSMLGEYREGE